MKLNEVALANALAAVSVGVSVLCNLAIILVPDIAKLVFQSWFHGVNLANVWDVYASSGSLILGAITMAVVTWVSGWAFAKVYNRFLK